MFNLVAISFLFVFAAMSLLVILISMLSELSFRRTKIKIRRQKFKEVQEHREKIKINRQELKLPKDVAIAISLALYMNRFLDEESQDQITMKKSTIPFSPWTTRGRGGMIANRMIFYRRK